MASIIDELKAEARILHREALADRPTALARLRAARVTAQPIKRAHCLTALARELGFQGWPHAVAVLEGRADADFGTLLYVGSGHFNIWSATYDEARAIRAEHGGYLLAYKRQFLIVDRYFIESLGLDPDDADWTHIARDWVRPEDPAARERLYAKLIRARKASRAGNPDSDRPKQASSE